MRFFFFFFVPGLATPSSPVLSCRFSLSAHVPPIVGFWRGLPALLSPFPPLPFPPFSPPPPFLSVPSMPPFVRFTRSIPHGPFRWPFSPLVFLCFFRCIFGEVPKTFSSRLGVFFVGSTPGWCDGGPPEFRRPEASTVIIRLPSR